MGLIVNDGMYREKDTCWFIGREDNILYKMHLANMEVECVACLPREKTESFRMYQRCIKKDSYIYCVPDRGNTIQVYDIKENRFHQIAIENPEEKRISIFDSWIDGEVLWCVSYGMNEIIAVNLINNSVIGIYSIFECQEDTCGFESLKVGRYIYCVSKSRPCIVEFDIETLDKKEYVFELAEKGFHTIAYDEEMFYLTGYSNSVYCWKKEDEQYIKQYLLPENFYFLEDSENTIRTPIFYHSFVLQKQVVFIPWNSLNVLSNYILCMDRQSKNFKKIDFGKKDSLRKSGEIFVVEYIKHNTIIGIHDTKNTFITEIDVDTEQIIQLDMVTDKRKDIEFWKKNINDKDILSEGLNCSLEVLFGACDIKKNSIEERNSTTGKIIWDNICF